MSVFIPMGVIATTMNGKERLHLMPVSYTHLRSHFPVFLGNVHPLRGIWLVRLIFECTYQPFNMG